MHKDVRYYLDSVHNAGTPAAVAQVIASLWQQVDAALPNSDINGNF